MNAPIPRDPYNAAMVAVRRLTDAGRFVPGEPIVVTEVAAEVGFSPTPVREALARLAGEGLIDRRRGHGYFYPALSASDLIDLFELQLAYLHAALILCPRGLASLRKAAAEIRIDDGVQALFDAIVQQSANAALIEASRRVRDRMKPVLEAERHLDPEDGSAVRAMTTIIAAGRIPDLLDQVQQYHEQRCARIERLTRMLAPA